MALEARRSNGMLDFSEDHMSLNNGSAFRKTTEEVYGDDVHGVSPGLEGRSWRRIVPYGDGVSPRV